MRAVFIEGLTSQPSYELGGEMLHHLVNVIRIERSEELLLLNGQGLQVKTKVMEVSKKLLRLSRISEEFLERPFKYDIAIGIPKKEALELSLKEAVELGVRSIYLVRGSFSQTRIPEKDRINSLLVSALEQSNSAYLPEVIELNWKDLPWNEYGTILLLDSQAQSKSAPMSKSSYLLVVGPEGGFSTEESEYFSSLERVEILRLPTPILRTPTAVAAGVGIVLQRLMS